MVKTFKLEILASDHVFYSGECDELVFPGQDGSFGILPNHQPMITCLNAGELRFRTGDEWHYAAVSDGFVEIMPSYVNILADTVEKPEEIFEHLPMKGTHIRMHLLLSYGRKSVYKANHN